MTNKNDCRNNPMKLKANFLLLQVVVTTRRAWSDPFLAPIVIKKDIPFRVLGNRRLQSLCPEVIKTVEEVNKMLGADRVECTCYTIPSSSWTRDDTYSVSCNIGEHCCPAHVCGTVQSHAIVKVDWDSGQVRTIEEDSCTSYYKGLSGDLCINHEFAQSGGTNKCAVELNGHTCNYCNVCRNTRRPDHMPDDAEVATYEYDCSNVPGGQEHSIDCTEAQALLDTCSGGTKVSSLLVLATLLATVTTTVMIAF